jgi:hypothetical protein
MHVQNNAEFWIEPPDKVGELRIVVNVYDIAAPFAKIEPYLERIQDMPQVD